MNTCSTCRWWSSVSPHVDPSWGECLGAHSSNLRRTNGEPFKMLAMGYDEWNLATKPDFGCNQWEGKDAV